jgi:hypothetical protein
MRGLSAAAALCSFPRNRGSALTRLPVSTSLTRPSGPKLIERAEKARPQKTIESIADKIEELALAASEGRAKYQEFESQLGELHAAGFYPEMSLISDVAHAMV